MQHALHGNGSAGDETLIELLNSTPADNNKVFWADASDSGDHEVQEGPVHDDGDMGLPTLVRNFELKRKKVIKTIVKSKATERTTAQDRPCWMTAPMPRRDVTNTCG